MYLVSLQSKLQFNTYRVDKTGKYFILGCSIILFSCPLSSMPSLGDCFAHWLLEIQRLLDQTKPTWQIYPTYPHTWPYVPNWLLEKTNINKCRFLKSIFDVGVIGKSISLFSCSNYERKVTKFELEAHGNRTFSILQSPVHVGTNINININSISALMFDDIPSLFSRLKNKLPNVHIVQCRQCTQWLSCTCKTCQPDIPIWPHIAIEISRPDRTYLYLTYPPDNYNWGRAIRKSCDVCIVWWCLMILNNVL